MKMCPTCEIPICNHCKHLRFNHPACTYDCTLHNKLDIDAADHCNDFECKWYTEPKGEKKIPDLSPEEWERQMAGEEKAP